MGGLASVFRHVAQRFSYFWLPWQVLRRRPTRDFDGKSLWAQGWYHHACRQNRQREFRIPSNGGLVIPAQTTRIRDIQEAYRCFKARGLRLNLTRGNPSSEQLDLCAGLLSPCTDYLAEGAIDCRNYGGLQGIVEARRLFSGMMGAPPDQVVVGNNSSLSVMHDIIVFALLKGTCDSLAPWSKQAEMKFLCPVPGYDRHFRICEQYGIRMIPVTLNDDGL